MFRDADADEIEIKIKEVEDVADLYQKRRGQYLPDPAYVYFDPERRLFWADAHPRESTPSKVYSKRVIQWGIPVLRAHVVNDWMEELIPYAQRIVKGYEEVWNGNNYVGRYSEDAQEAIDDIASELAQDWGENDFVQVWDAEDYLSGQSPEEVGITLGMSDSELDTLADKIRDEAVNVDVLINLIPRLEYLHNYLNNEFRDIWKAAIGRPPTNEEWDATVAVAQATGLEQAEAFIRQAGELAKY